MDQLLDQLLAAVVGALAAAIVATATVAVTAATAAAARATTATAARAAALFLAGVLRLDGRIGIDLVSHSQNSSPLSRAASASALTRP